jgi:hypothetical protein
VDLPLLEEPVDIEAEARGESHAVLAYRHIVITEAEAEIEGVVWCGAHPAHARRKRMAETMLTEELRMQGAHYLLCSTVDSLHP